MPLLSIAPFVLCVFVIILNGMHSDKTQEVSPDEIVAKYSWIVIDALSCRSPCMISDTCTSPVLW
jgi:hypothetical protein